MEIIVLFLAFIHIFMTYAAYPVSKFNIKHPSLYTAYLCETLFRQNIFANKKSFPLASCHCLTMVFGKGQPQPGKWQRTLAQKATGTKTSRKNKKQKEEEQVDDHNENDDHELDLNNDVYQDEEEEYDEEDEDVEDDDVDEDDVEEDGDEDEDKSEDDEDVSDRPLTMVEKKSYGIDYVTQKEVRIAIKVAYIREFHSPDEEEWKKIVTNLQNRYGLSRKVIKRVFIMCRDGVANPEKQKVGAGRKAKLGHDNVGLIAGAAALNGSASPSMARDICNATNAQDGHPELKVSKNTFMQTIKASTDCESVSILRRKTGSKDPESAWAKARMVFATQLTEQVKLGQDIDNGVTSSQQVFEEVENGSRPPPIYRDGILFCDENHNKACIGGAGHDSHSSKKQWRIAVCPKTGALKRLKEGGVQPSRKYRVVAKYTTEARGCYAACINGEGQGEFMETFDYTGATLLSLKKYNVKVNEELARRRKQKGEWKNFNGANPYLERYGDDWEIHVKNAPKMCAFK
jgi:hypothetical protein